MQRCSSHGNMVGPCSCGSHGSSFSFLFAPLPSKTSTTNETTDTDAFASSSSTVDCTLSLGTPSTRQIEAISHQKYQRPPVSSSSCMSNLCWDIFQAKQPSLSSSQKSSGGRGGTSSSSSSLLNISSDTRLNGTRRCANCDTTSTPLWRNGPRGPKSLCNACGIRYKKEERRATSTSTLEGPQQHLMMNHQHQQHHQWAFAAQTSQRAQTTTISPAAFNNNSEFRLIEDDNDDGDSSPFLSWRLSVPPSPDFPVQYTT